MNKSKGWHGVPRPLRGWVLPLLLLVVWSWTAARLDSPLLVSPQEVWRYGVGQVADGALWHALGASLTRALWGFAIGAAAGLLFGGLLGASRWAERLFGPSFHTIKQISLFAWVPLLSVWFGLGETGKVAFVALAAFFPMVLNTFEGLRAIPREYLEVARVHALTPAQCLRRVIVPAAAPALFAGLHLALIYAWLATLGAEYLLASGVGIGTLLIDGREQFAMDQVLFGVVIIGLVGALLNALASRLEHRVLRWRERSVAQY